ncbi:MAG: hypothetical protein HY606_06620 [Planctomycetes bacterium]|nr:hypothetical protein [Planctomycetota bacterium]
MKSFSKYFILFFILFIGASPLQSQMRSPVVTAADILNEVITNFIMNVSPHPIANLFIQDLNSDGLVDAIGNTFQAGHIRYVHGDVNQISACYNVDSRVDDLTNFTVFDVDKDSDQDVLALAGIRNQIHVFLNTNGTFAFGANPDLVVNLNFSGTPVDIKPLDLLDDGTPDYLMVLSNDASTGIGAIQVFSLPNLNFIITIPFNGNPMALYDVPFKWFPFGLPLWMVLLDNGKLLYWDLTFGITPIDLSSFVETANLKHIDFLDINNDNLMDFYTRHASRTIDQNGFVILTDEIRVYQNKIGQGGIFQLIHQFILPKNTFWLVPADYDLDGKTDIITNNFNQGIHTFSAFKNLGGVLAPLTNILNSLALQAIALTGNISSNLAQISDVWMGIEFKNEKQIDTTFKGKINSLIATLQNNVTQLNNAGQTSEAQILQEAISGVTTQLAQNDVYEAKIDGALAFTRFWSSSITYDNIFTTADFNDPYWKSQFLRVTIHEGLLAYSIANFCGHDNIADEVIPLLEALATLPDWASLTPNINQRKADEKVEQIQNNSYDVLIAYHKLYNDSGPPWNLLVISTSDYLKLVKKWLKISTPPDDLQITSTIGAPVSPSLFGDGQATYESTLNYCGATIMFACEWD